MQDHPIKSDIQQESRGILELGAGVSLQGKNGGKHIFGWLREKEIHSWMQDQIFTANNAARERKQKQKDVNLLWKNQK